MADVGSTGNFDPKAQKVSKSKGSDKKSDKPNPAQIENTHRETHLKQIRQENRGRYLNASDAQKFVPRASREDHIDKFSPELAGEEDEDLVTPFKAKEEKEKALVKNPLLKSKLDLLAKSKQNNNLDNFHDKKMKPPKPSLKSLLAPKGNIDKKMSYEELINLNPHLKKVSSVEIDNMKELQKTIEGELNLEKSEKLLNSKDKSNKNQELAPLASLFDLDEIFFTEDFNPALLKDFLQAIISDENSPQSVQEQISDSLNFISEDNILQDFILMNLPYPFPLFFKRIDDEFEDIVEELEDENEKQNQNDETYDNEGDEEDDDDEEFIPTSVAALAIETYNFVKILAILKYSKEQNKLELSFKGDINGEELAIAINSSIEFEMPLDTRIKEKRFKTWKNKFYGHIEAHDSRHVQTFIEGDNDPIFLKACNTLVHSVLRSDQDISAFEKNKGGRML